MMRTALLGSLPLALAGVAGVSLAQAPNGDALFTTHCAACHLNPTEKDVPTRATMATLAPNSIVESLNEGTMRIQG